MNLLESQLGAWIPRSPSPRLKARLFGRALPVPSEAAGSIGWGWLAQVAGLLLLAALGLSQSHFPSVQHVAADSHRLLASVAGSNGGWHPFGLDRNGGERNLLPDTFLKLTNAQRSASSIDFLLLLTTNNIR